MEENYKITQRYLTDPTGEQIDEIFGEVLEQIHDKMDTAQGKNSTAVAKVNGNIMSLITVYEDERRIKVKLQSKTGSQEDGYLVMLEFEDNYENPSQDTTEFVYEVTMEIMNRVVDGEKVS